MHCYNFLFEFGWHVDYKYNGCIQIQSDWIGLDYHI